MSTSEPGGGDIDTHGSRNVCSCLFSCLAVKVTMFYLILSSVLTAFPPLGERLTYYLESLWRALVNLS